MLNALLSAASSVDLDWLTIERIAVVTAVVIALALLVIDGRRRRDPESDVTSVSYDYGKTWEPLPPGHSLPEHVNAFRWEGRDYYRRGDGSFLNEGDTRSAHFTRTDR